MQLKIFLRDTKVLHDLVFALLFITLFLHSNLLHEAVQDTVPSVDNEGCAKPLTDGTWWPCQPHWPLFWACFQAYLWVFTMFCCPLGKFSLLPPQPPATTSWSGGLLLILNLSLNVTVQGSFHRPPHAKFGLSCLYSNILLFFFQNFNHSCKQMIIWVMKK